MQISFVLVLTGHPFDTLLPEMVFSYCKQNVFLLHRKSADALNTGNGFARGNSYSDEILTTGYDDLDNTSKKTKVRNKRYR